MKGSPRHVSLPGLGMFHCGRDESMCCLLRDPAAERREKAGRRSCNLAVQILGPQAEHPGRLLRRATVGAEGAEHGAGKGTMRFLQTTVGSKAARPAAQEFNSPEANRK